jgi:hypothetical protein
MKVISPFGEYPFQFRRLERRGATVVVLGTVAGVESGIVLDAADLRAAAKLAAVATALGAGLAFLARRA